jgi:recA bacterial DNA recombination protein
MSLARADLESLLRTRQLDRTLTTSRPSRAPTDEYAMSATGVTGLDERLGGGFPRGQLSEIVGARSSGRTSLLLQMLAAADARGELVALVDALDMLDVESAAAAGVDLDGLLWIRGHVAVNPGFCLDTNQRALEQAVRALALVLQAGNFGLVALDVGEAPASAIRRLPFTTWLRLQRLIEGSRTALILVSRELVARSSAGVTLKLGIRNSELGISKHVQIDAQVIRARR